MKKRIAVYGSALAVLCVYFFAGSFFPGVTIGNYLFICKGEHAAEIERRLGGPNNGPAWRSGTPDPNMGWIECWHGRVITIEILYDRDCRVVSSSMRPNSLGGSWLGSVLDAFGFPKISG